MKALFRCLILCLTWCFQIAADPDYHERLNLTPLPSSLLASFSFRSNASRQSFEQQHFRYIPRSLGQVLQHAKTQELHLRFSTGRWDDESWNTRPWGGTKEGGTGVELWAWIEAKSDEEYGLPSPTEREVYLNAIIGPLRVGLLLIMLFQGFSAPH